VRVARVVALFAVVLSPSLGVALSLQPGFEAAAVATGLDQPTAAAFAPDGRLFILEKAGTVRLWRPGEGLLAAPVLALPSCTDSEMGLLGLAFDPGFADTGGLYLYHTHPPNGDITRCASATGRTNRIVRVRVAGDVADPATLVVVFDGIRTDNGNHDGGQLAIGPDGFLYAGVGDSGVGDAGPPGAAQNPYAQDVTSPNGKILRLTLDGRGAPGNPFTGQGGASDAVFAYGLRNPFRFTFQPGTGLLWVADVGQDTWEEIDVVRAGDNLGWPQCEGLAPRPQCPGQTVPPVYQYPHDGGDAAVIGGVFYDGSQFATQYRGSYFFADFERDIIWRAQPTASSDGFEHPPDVFARGADGPVDLTVGPDGALYYVALGAGEVRRLAQQPEGVNACSLAVGRRSTRWLRAAGRAIEACTRHGGKSCFPPPRVRLRAAAARLARGVARSCAAPPAALCTRLACTACATASELASCAGSVARAAAADLGLRTRGTEDSRCAGAAFRAGIRFAAARSRAITRCVRGSAAGCIPGPGDPDRLVRRLAHRCAAPPPALCASFACEPCGSVAELGQCIAGSVGTAVDAYAVQLYGSS